MGRQRSTTHTGLCGSQHSVCSTSEGRRGGSSHLCCFPEKRVGFGHQSGSHQASQIEKYPCKITAEIMQRPGTNTARNHQLEGKTRALLYPAQGLQGCICKAHPAASTSACQDDSFIGRLLGSLHHISNIHFLNKDVMIGASRR